MKNPKAEIWHYASPYYDPVKAHEYYMRRRMLKRRPRQEINSLPDLEKSIPEEKPERSEAKSGAQSPAGTGFVTDNGQAQWKSMQLLMAKHRVRMERSISNLRNEIHTMSVEERDNHSASIQKKIEILRAYNNKERDRITHSYAPLNNRRNEPEE